MDALNGKQITEQQTMRREHGHCWRDFMMIVFDWGFSLTNACQCAFLLQPFRSLAAQKQSEGAVLSMHSQSLIPALYSQGMHTDRRFPQHRGKEVKDNSGK